MSLWLKLYCQLLLLFFAGTAWVGAQPIDINEGSQTFKPILPCPMATADDTDHHPVYFFQHKFPDGSQDLAIAKSLAGEVSDIKRVTFGGDNSAECHYKYLAIARGGDWGWHLLWLAGGSTTLRYARMDGEAWVTSPTKKLTLQSRPTNQPIILTFGQQVRVVWIEAALNTSSVYAVYSGDEGRSWQDVKMITQTGSALSNLQLVEKESKPYLVGQGLAEPLPLASW
ncbi:MAG: hypothetical protein WA123_05600 [Methylotenera sp.]